MRFRGGAQSPSRCRTACRGRKRTSSGWPSARGRRPRAGRSCGRAGGAAAAAARSPLALLRSAAVRLRSRPTSSPPSAWEQQHRFGPQPEGHGRTVAARSRLPRPGRWAAAAVVARAGRRGWAAAAAGGRRRRWLQRHCGRGSPGTPQGTTC